MPVGMEFRLQKSYISRLAGISYEEHATMRSVHTCMWKLILMPKYAKHLRQDTVHKEGNASCCTFLRSPSGWGQSINMRIKMKLLPFLHQTLPHPQNFLLIYGIRCNRRKATSLFLHCDLVFQKLRLNEKSLIPPPRQHVDEYLIMFSSIEIGFRFRAGVRQIKTCIYCLRHTDPYKVGKYSKVNNAAQNTQAYYNSVWIFCGIQLSWMVLGYECSTSWIFHMKSTQWRACKFILHQICKFEANG